MTATYFVQDHVIFRFPADAMVRWQPRATAQKTTRADMQILYSLLSQYLRHSVLNNVRGRYEKCIVPGNKDFWIR